MTTRQRRICWPEFDATCLEGGCIHCNDHPFRSESTILRAVRKMTTTQNRYGSEVRDPQEAYDDGLRANWRNAETRTRK